MALDCKPDAVWVDTARGEAGRGGEPLPLSRQEFSVLAALAASSGRVVARNELARRAGLSASPRRCDQLLVGVRRALGPDSVRTVRGRGWILTIPVTERPPGP